MKALFRCLALSVCLFTSECAMPHVAHAHKKTVKVNDPFRERLAQDYRQYNGGCACDKYFLNRRAKLLLSGVDLSPLDPHRRFTARHELSDLANSRVELLKVLQEQKARPELLADLQFYYECWVLRSDDVGTRNKMPVDNTCKDKFKRLLQWIQDGCKCKFKYIIPLHDENRQISKKDATIIRSFMMTKHSSGDYVMIFGSEKNAKKVSDVLVTRGISQDSIKIVNVERRQNDVAVVWSEKLLGALEAGCPMKACPMSCSDEHGAKEINAEKHCETKSCKKADHHTKTVKEVIKAAD